MDTSSFDRIARLLGGAATRRQGLAAVLAGALGLAVPAAAPAVSAAPGDGGPREEAKCLDGKTPGKKRCRKHTDCCTGYCKKIRKRKNGKVRKTRRCRCAPKGFVCGAKTECCRGLTCAKGKCSLPTPPNPGKTVPTGEACVAGVDTCADPAATCAAYQGGNPAGTHCVLPESSACTTAGDCVSHVCNGGSCAARVTCTVCSSGCEYSTVQAAITALETATTMQTVYIAGGDYSEDLALNGKISLAACNGEEVILRSATNAGNRTIFLSAVNAELELTDITVTAKLPFDAAKGGGGIYTMSYCKVTLNGTTSISGNSSGTSYGGAIDLSTGSQLIMNGSSTISGNKSGHFNKGGGGVYMGTEATIEMNDDSSITDNEDESVGGGGIWAADQDTSIVTMNDRSQITGNRTGANGGGLWVASAGCLVINSPDVRITGNTATGIGGGVFQDAGSSAPAAVTATIVNGNTATANCNNYWLDASSGTCILT